MAQKSDLISKDGLRMKLFEHGKENRQTGSSDVKIPFNISSTETWAKKMQFKPVFSTLIAFALRRNNIEEIVTDFWWTKKSRQGWIWVQLWIIDFETNLRLISTYHYFVVDYSSRFWTMRFHFFRKMAIVYRTILKSDAKCQSLLAAIKILRSILG